ncbi:MAG: PhzF family phenazine biosynthesis protein [Pseudomonadota bacterium]
MTLAFHTLDVFTDQRFAGNSLAVVLGADGLSTDVMQTIAREFNLSETVFVLKAENPAVHSARIRIFTPRHELPFAGHPIVGVSALLAQLHTPVVNGEQDAIISLEANIGAVRVGVRLKGQGLAFAEFDAPKLPKPAGKLPPVEKLAAGLGLIPNEIGFENHKPMCFAAGPAFAFIPVSTREAISKARVDPRHWADAFEEQGIVGAYLYTRQCVHTSSAFHTRMFAPASGIPEDPATGAAAVCLAGVVHEFDDYPDGVHKRIVEQGYAMGRPSHITISSVVRAGKLETVRIGGQSVRISDGTLRLAGPQA